MSEAVSSKSSPVRHDLYIGRVAGIRFYLDYSWFLIAGLVIYTLSAKVFPELAPHRSDLIYLSMGVAAALLFFVSILLHELGHSVVSQRCGIPVPRITLLFIGGLAELSREPDDARSELKIALAGPAVSLILVIFYESLAQVFARFGTPPLTLVFSWLATVNLALVIFNAIPGYPLDGGRVLRALLWMRSGKLGQSTYVTSRIGIGFSWLLMALGLSSLFFFREWNGFLLVLIGIFLKTAAESGYASALYQEVLTGVQVRDLMSREPISLPMGLPLNLAVDDYFLATHHVAFPVCDHDGRFRGLLRLEYLKGVPRERWPFTTAGDVAAEHDSAAAFIPAAAPAAQALSRLLIPGQGRLAVVDEDRLVGIITRHDILQFIKIRSELDPRPAAVSAD